MVREYEVEAVQQVTLIIDNALSASEQRDAQAREQLERVISWGASLGVFYLERGYAVYVSVRSTAAPLPLLLSPSSMSRLLTMLALIETVTPEVPFQTLPQLPQTIGDKVCERADCLLIIRPGRPPQGAPLPREAAAAHVVEAS
jgi:uncharacterized protein (DUF58 family)